MSMSRIPSTESSQAPGLKEQLRGKDLLSGVPQNPSWTRLSKTQDAMGGLRKPALPGRRDKPRIPGNHHPISSSLPDPATSSEVNPFAQTSPLRYASSAILIGSPDIRAPEK